MVNHGMGQPYMKCLTDTDELNLYFHIAVKRLANVTMLVN